MITQNIFWYLQEITARTEVPELSVVFESSESNAKMSNSPSYATRQSAQETYGSYNEWKNRKTSPVHKETRYYEPRNKHSYGSPAYSDCDQNPYNRFTDKISYKSSNDYHNCACQNTPTVKDIYIMMQMQNEQIKFLLETVQKLSITLLSNQQNQHKCCCFINSHCQNLNNIKPTVSKTSETPAECELDHFTEKPQTSLKKDKNIPGKNESNKGSKLNKSDNILVSKDKVKQQVIRKVSDSEKDNQHERERANSAARYIK